MAGQGLTRRKALQYMALAATVSQFTGFEKWAYAHSHDRPVAQPTGKPYKLHFFSKKEYATISALSERIIPSDGTPGAREAGVAEFIDLIVFYDKGDVQPAMRRVVADVNAMAYELHDSSFVKLDAQKQDEAIARLMTEKKKSFDLIRNYVVMGYFNSKVGMEYLDVPFLKSWDGGTDCKHFDDPEHKKVFV
jgi:hypothetical protein